MTSSIFAQPSLSGTVEDTAKRPIDGANITVWDAGTGKGIRTSSSMGSFSLNGLAEGDHLFKVEKDSTLPVLGAFHLAGDEPHRISVVVLSAGPQATETPWRWISTSRFGGASTILNPSTQSETCPS